MWNGLGRIWHIARIPILLVAVVVLLLLTLRLAGLPSDAFLSLVSAIIGGLIATLSQVWFSERDRQTRLQLAALDKRLEAAQRAYARWRRLCYLLIDYEALDEIVLECQTWWDDNCLYLTAPARQAFRSAYLDAKLMKNLRANRDLKALQENWNHITEAGRIIESSVYLPALSGWKDEFPQPSLNE